MAMYKIDVITERVVKTLQAAGASAEMARSTAQALVAAEMQGLGSHGLSRVAQYAAHLRSGRVNPHARPTILRSHGAGVLVDADEGLAFPACALAIEEAIRRAREYTIAFSGVTRSHHFGAAGVHLDAVGRAGMVGLAFSNSPAAMTAWGGSKALFGTNPIAAVFPRRNDAPLTIDLSLSEVARGKLMVAARDGKAIPEGWALDKQGRPTTDPKAGMEGTMCPAGGVKGAMLAMMVELLCVSLTGAAFGFEADSFFSEEGNRPHSGHVFLVIDPGALGNMASYFDRTETLVQAMLADEQVRLPGSRRQKNAQHAAQTGIEVSDAIVGQLLA